MFPLLVEGLDSAISPCTWVVLIPGVAVALASRYYSTLAIFGFTVGLVLISWFQFSERMGDWSNYAIALAMLIASFFFLRPITDRLDLVSTGAGALVGGAATAMWDPCVGAEFGSLLSDLRSGESLGPVFLTVYVIGLLAPLFILGALFYLIPDGFQERVEKALANVGSVSLLLMALLIGGGFHSGVISWLVQLSST